MEDTDANSGHHNDSCMDQRTSGDSDSDVLPEPRSVASLSIEHLSTEDWPLFDHLSEVLQQDWVNDHFRKRVCILSPTTALNPFGIGGDGLESLLFMAHELVEASYDDSLKVWVCRVFVFLLSP